jgi:hypothetical protein
MLSPAQFPLQIVRLVPKPFDGDDWLFEMKHDGFRASPMPSVPSGSGELMTYGYLPTA